MFTLLEDLPNELILQIVEYVKIRDLAIGLWNLNQRLNRLICSIRCLSLTITKNDTFESILFSKQITRIVIVTLTRISLNSFINLRSLTLNMINENQLKQIRAEILPNLVYLSIPITFDYRLIKSIASDVFSNQYTSLQYTDLRLVNVPELFSWSQSPSLHSIHIFSPNINIIPLILLSCTQLTHFQIRITEEHDLDLSSLPVICNHPLKYFLFMQSQTSTFVYDIINILYLIPNIKRLDLRLCTRSFIDLLDFIFQSFPNIIRFDCHIIEYPNKDETIDINRIRNIHPIYSSIQYTLREDCFCLYTSDISR